MIVPTLKGVERPLNKTEWALLHTIWVLEHHHPKWRQILTLRQHHEHIDSITKRWEYHRGKRTMEAAAKAGKASHQIRKGS